MLADWAEAINGKLYIQGGAWSRVPAAGGPIRCALAIKVAVPWNEANTQHKLRIRLVNADGQAILVGDDNRPVEIETAFEVGRPAGLPPGTDLDVTLAPNFLGLPLQAGRYRFNIELDDLPVTARATFDVT